MWNATGNMPGPGFGDAAVLLRNGDVYSPTVNLYSTSNGTWTTTSAPPVGGSPIALLPNGNVWTAGSSQGESLYNPSTNQWITFAPPPCTTTQQGCESAAMTLETGMVLVAGGITEIPRTYPAQPIKQTNGFAAVFNPLTLTWAKTSSTNGQVLVVGGETFEKSSGSLVPISSAELYTPQSREVIATRTAQHWRTPPGRSITHRYA